jgi:membrane-associated phospholipid phosphatase
VNTVRKNIGPLSIFILFFTIGLFIVIVYPKLEIQRHINSFYHPKANIIFKFLTHLAEGWFTVPLLVFLFIYNWKKAVYISSIYGISSLFVAVLKHLVFSTFKRPHWFNELLNDKNYRWLPDVNMHDEFSFPSGHTTTAFCIFFGLALLIPNKKNRNYFDHTSLLNWIFQDLPFLSFFNGLGCWFFPWSHDSFRNVSFAKKKIEALNQVELKDVYFLISF